MTRQPDLCFPESQDFPGGFTQNSMTSFRDLNPFVIVREFIQNSQDAILGTRQRKVVVRFQVEEIKTADIPGIASYKSAFEKAVQRCEEEASRGLNHQERIITNRICAALDQPTQSLLVVSDNGEGLAQSTMGAILADGESRKKDGAGGAYGNGHFAPFPASDLRYLLYAGINNGKWICSGHAVLASHYKGRTPRSANGYYINGNKAGARKYPGKSQCPPIVRKALREIEDGPGHGTAVLVTAFNYFQGSKATLRDAIAEAAVCNFFPAIYDRKLEIAVSAQDGGWVLNHSNLREVLSEYREKKRNKDFLSGQKANASFRALSGDPGKEVEIMGGKVQVHIARPAPTGKTRTNLFRNGMWITNSDKQKEGIPCFYNKFGNYESFEAAILVSAKAAPEFHDLIRRAEGATHISLNQKAILPEDKTELRRAFAELRDWLKAQARELTDDAYSPSDFLSFSSDAGESGAGGSPGMRGALTPFYRRASGHRRHEALGDTGLRGKGRGKKTGKKRGSTRSGNQKRPTLPPIFNVVVTPRDNGARKISLRSTQDCADLELRLLINDNQDPTTDRIWKDRVVKITGRKSMVFQWPLMPSLMGETQA